MSAMDVKALRCFLAVAEAGNITKAARALYLAQPTLSRQMKELENELGCELFVRHSHSISLTKDGLKLRARALEIVNLVDRAIQEFAPQETGMTGDVYLGAGESSCMFDIARVMEELQARHPNVTLHLRTGYDHQIEEWLERGAIDFGVLFEPADYTKYHHLRLPTVNRWGLVIRADNMLACKDAVSPDDLKGERVIVSRQATRRNYTANPFLEWIGYDVDELDIAATMDLPTNATFLVQHGIASLFTFEGLTNLAEDSNLAFKPLTPDLFVNSELCWRKNHLLSSAAEAFLELAKQVLIQKEPANEGNQIALKD